jgi:hypothetical protein
MAAEGQAFSAKIDRKRKAFNTGLMQKLPLLHDERSNTVKPVTGREGTGGCLSWRYGPWVFHVKE